MCWAVFGFWLGFCAPPASSTYTLYRNSLVGPATTRIHVATFNAADGADYNLGNCRLAARLFQAQPDVRTTFWCERGTFSP